MSFRSEAKESAVAFAVAIAFAVPTAILTKMPRRDYTFYVYILASRSLNLYVGLTNNLHARVLQHREKRAGTFTARYNINLLVYFEQFAYVNNAIAREKELKDWNRERKIALIKSTNPTWQDFAADW